MEWESKQLKSITNLGHRTNVLFSSFFGDVLEKEEYWIIKTPSRPNFFWGNYVLMKSQPTEDCLSAWLEIFEREIGKRKERGFVAITYDAVSSEDNCAEEFEKEGFTVFVNNILTATKVQSTAKINPAITVKPFSTMQDWRDYKRIHTDPEWKYGSMDAQSNFLDEEIRDFQKILAKGHGQRFGAFENEVMIAELGVYWEGEIARFNNVGTAEEHRRKGACTTLVYEVCQHLLQQGTIRTLVMEADESYHATKIYESVGFIPTQKTVSFQWHDRKKFG